MLPGHIAEQVGRPLEPSRESVSFGHTFELNAALQGSSLARYGLYAFLLFKIYTTAGYWPGRMSEFFVVAGTSLVYEFVVALLRAIDARRIETRSEGKSFRGKATFFSSLIFTVSFVVFGLLLNEGSLIVFAPFPALVGFFAARHGLDTLFSQKLYTDDEPVE